MTSRQLSRLLLGLALVGYAAVVLVLTEVRP